MNLMDRRRALMAQGTAEPSPFPMSVEFPFSNYHTIINMSTGAASGNNSWTATDYIEIPTGANKLRFINELGSTISFRGAFYDTSKAWITSDLTSLWPIGNGASSYKTIPSTAKYVRLSTNNWNGATGYSLTFVYEE